MKQDMQYGVSVNGRPGRRAYASCRDYALSADGEKVAALVQVEDLPEADIFKFLEGTWSVAVNGEAWERKYLNVYAPCFDADGTHVAVEVRTDATEYTVAQDDEPWEAKYTCIWEPAYRPGKGGIVVPVRQGGAWTLVEGGKPLWKSRFMQLWRQRFSPTASGLRPWWRRAYRALDDRGGRRRSWEQTFGDMVLAPHFSPDGKHVAATVKEGNRWGVAVDGRGWSEDVRHGVGAGVLAWGGRGVGEGRAGGAVSVGGERPAVEARVRPPLGSFGEPGRQARAGPRCSG
jgi:hypothetical protein